MITPGTPVNRFQERSQRTRAALLRAGMDAVLSEPASGVFAHLTAQRVATGAGRTTGSFFHQWATIEEYRRDLIRFILDPSRALTWAAVAETAAEALTPGGDLVEGIRAVGRGALEATPRDAQTLLEVLMWIRAVHDEAFRVDVEEMYAELDQFGTDFVDALLARFGRELRPPYTALAMACVLSALTQGLSVRTVLTPGVMPADVLGDVLLSVIPMLTRPVGDTEETSSWLDRSAQRELG